MSFSALEILGGKPRELYTFARSDQMWRYASAGRAVPVTYGLTTLVYDGAIIERGRIQRAQETGAVKVHVKVGRTVPVAAALREYRMHPMVLGIHRQQDDPSSAPVLQAYGNVSGVTLNGGWVEFDLVTADAQFGQPFPRLIFDQTCQLQFASGRCGVNEADFSFETTIVAIDRSKITVDAVPMGTVDGYYDAGQVRLSATRERCFIAKHVATDLHIFGRVPTGVLVGDTVTLIAGDDKSLTTCRDRFDNVLNFLGFDQLPVTDPLQTGVET